MADTIINQQPIQVRKVSQLPNYAEYVEKLNSYNSYVMVGYPSNENTPHNFKITLDDIQKMAYTYTAEQMLGPLNAHISYITQQIYDHFNNKIDTLLSYILNYVGEYPDISYYWNIVGYYVKQRWSQDYARPEDYMITIRDEKNNELHFPVTE